jgi:hypothetical protein
MELFAAWCVHQSELLEQIGNTSSSRAVKIEHEHEHDAGGVEPFG